MNIVELLNDLAARQVSLWLDGDQLRYRAPKDALTPQLVNTLKQHKPDVIAWLRQRADFANGTLVEYPVSQGQLGLWLDWQVEPQSSRYVLATVYRLPMDIDLERLRNACQTLLDRHPVLRTTYQVHEGSTIPVQRVHKELAVDFAVIDAAHWSPSEFDAWIDSTSERPFDLQSGPITRFAVARGKNESLLVWTIHHIATDYTTQQLLFAQLRAIYLQQSPEPAPTELTFHDYVRWEQDDIRLRGEQTTAFWRDYLSDRVSLLDLPGRPAKGAPNAGNEFPFVFAQDLVDKLRALARAHKVTLNTVILSAFQLLIFRYTQQEDFLLASPLTMRALPALAQTVGYFVNSLVLRANLTGVSSFGELLQRTHDTYGRVSQHSTYPYFEQLRLLQKHARPSEIYEGVLMYVFVALRQDANDFAPFEMRSSRQGGRPHALGLTVFEHPHELRGLVTYDAERFDSGFIERMVGHLQTLLAHIATDSGQSIRTTSILSPAERYQILEQWNQTQVDFPRDTTIVQLFEANVAKAPHQVAVVFQDRQLTYGELNTRANQLAHRLRALGLGREVVVPLCLERSMDLIVGMLGVLKAGGAYLNVDSEYPRHRIAFMIEDNASPVVLTHSALRNRLPRGTHEILELDDWTNLSAYPTENPEVINSAIDVACLIYTSGSTGKPKGAVITHRNISRLLFGTDYATIGPRTAVLFTSAISFDGTTFDVWAPLLHGVKCVIYPERVPSGAGLQEIVGRHGINISILTTALFNAIVDDDVRQLAGLEQILIGGEALSPQHLARAYAQLSNTALINGYGPAESTTYTSTHHYRSLDDCETATIGKPIANTQCYILDPHLNPVPPGIVGELYVAGEGLARGYSNRPALTAQRFVPHPFSNIPGQKMYRTGDLARYSPDGKIDFLGRADHQVKIRGFRIELGEIESVLASHSEVAHAVVLARQDVPGSKRLIAYVVPKTGCKPDENTLRAHMATILPEFMLPSHVLFLDNFPLTPNGKVDRKVLPAPAAFSPSSTSAVEPRTPVEQSLHDIFCSVLNLPRLGILNNFFELGGHSLLATLVVSRIRQMWNVVMPLRTFFDEPTIAGLAKRIEQSAQAKENNVITRANRLELLPLSFAQERLWFLERMGTASCVYNMPSVLRLSGQVDVEALEKSVKTIVARHESLRTRFPVVEGRPSQNIDEESFALACLDLRGLSPDERIHEVNRLIDHEVHHVFDLACGPLFRAKLVQVAADTFYLVQNTHHIVFDGWSMKVFYRELSALYAAFVEGKPCPLPNPALQYIDFASWQRRQWADQTMATQLAYWSERLASAPERLDLPTDRPRLSVQTYRGAHHFFRLPESMVPSLRAVGTSANATLFMTCLAAWNVLLARYTGQTDLVVGSPIANRNHVAIETLIGFFVNNLALRSDLSGDISFLELLEQVKITTLDAYKHQDVPFGKLVEHLKIPRNVSHAPIFQVMFDLFNRQIVQCDLPGLVVETLDDDITFPFAKFDLTLSMIEQSPTHVSGRLEYNTDLFDRSTIERMAEHYQRLLQSIVDHPAQSIHTLPLLSPAERQHMIALGKPSATQGSSSLACFHQLFEAQVARTPNAIAILFDDCTRLNDDADHSITLTYQDLNERANRLARHLRNRGVTRETFVGLCVDKTPETIISLLAIWKAGGVFVPIDTTYPPERLAFLLADANVSYLLTRHESLTTTSVPPANVIIFDELLLADESPKNLDLPISPADAAYMIYTSGSTGKPKGVVVEHKSLVHTSNALQDTIGLSAKDRHLLFFALSFDGGLADVLLPLRVGATLCLAPPQAILPGPPLHRYLRKHAISSTIVTPTALAQLLNPDLPALRTLMVAGEACPAELVSRWQPGRRFLNLYGVTEAAIFSTFAECLPDGRTPTIGRPALGNEVYVLDRFMEPVPMGVAGELFLGGAGVARGYWQRPELTADRFINNPFGPGRLYRTGDRARFVVRDADKKAEVEFLGRLDNQVKLRGFRIELGEIEAVLRRHPDVRDVVVTLHPASTGPRIVAYVASSSASPPALRNFVQSQLPDYMIPSFIMRVDALPLTSSGKVDLRALPEPHAERVHIAPQNAIEKRIAALWCDVLQIDQVGTHDNFFEVGGNSLLVIQLHAKLQESFGRQLSVTDLFQHPTVAALAAFMSRDGDEDNANVPVQDDRQSARIARDHLQRRRQMQTPESST